MRFVSLTDKGRRLLEALTSFYDRDATELSAALGERALGSCGQALQHLEQAFQLAEDRSPSEPDPERSHALSSGGAASGDDQEEQDVPSFDALLEALKVLSPEQREALILTRAEDLTYEEAARVCGVAVGTIKSRINRGGERLAELLNGSGSTAS